MRSNLLKYVGGILLCLLYSSILSAQSNAPGGVSNGLVLWLDASDINANGTAVLTGTQVTSWKDKSGAGHDAISTGTNTPVVSAVGPDQKPSLLFTRASAAGGSAFNIPGLDIRAGADPNVTIITVYRTGTHTINDNLALWGQDAGNNKNNTGYRQFLTTYKPAAVADQGNLGAGDAAFSVPGSGNQGAIQQFTAVYANGTSNGSAGYLNGKQIALFTDNTPTNGGSTTFKIGNDGDDNYFNGDICEVLVYNRVLSACEQEEINNFLGNKYENDFSNMGSYFTLGVPFTHNLNGIGKLNSACGSTSNISAAFSDIVSVTNPSRNNTPGVVLSFANDGAGYGLSSQTPNTYNTRLQQVWRADLNGNIGTVDICFELTGLGIDVSNTGNFALLIDKDGDFSDAQVVSTGITTLVNRVCISGVNITKGDYFTLATSAAASTASVITSTNEHIPEKAAFNTPTVVDDQITIKGSNNITNGRVYIDTGFVAGDALTYGTPPTGVTASYDAGTGALSFTGSATAAQWQALYRTIKFSTTNSNVGDRTIRFVLGNVVSYVIGTKPHYYEYITTTMSWTAAKAAAASRTLFGLQGYLATSTSQIENDFITSKLSSDGWVGGTCNVTEVNNAVGHTVSTNQSSSYGKYYWVTGPEAGTPISTGLTNPVAVGGAYTNWNGGEPNNYQNTDEEYMQLYSTQAGRWNDLNNSNNLGYVVEYGGYASDPVLNIDYSRVMKNSPPAPVIVSFATDNGASNSDYITSDNTLSISGTGQSSATIKLYRQDQPSTPIGTATVSSGNWTVNIAGALPDGTYTFFATATTSSLTSGNSNTIQITVDATAPAKPGTPYLADGMPQSNSATPVLQGSAEPNTTVKVYDGATLIGITTADPAGVWTLTAPTMADASTHSITATATDVAGNTSIASDPFSLKIDLTKPATPNAPVLVGDNGTHHTNNNTPDISGKTEANSTVTVYVDNVNVGTAIADGSGNYTYTLPVQIDGAHSVSITATDAAGNISDRSVDLNIVIDTQAPATPDAPIYQSGKISGGTNDNTPSIKGTITEPGDVVTIYLNDAQIGTTTADAVTGNYSFTFAAQPDAAYVVTVTATDAAGNVSATSPGMNMVVDTQAPAAPPAPAYADNRTGGVTNDNTPDIKGTAEALSTVTIWAGTTDLGTTTADAGGNYTFILPARSDADYQIVAQATDTVGNVGAKGSAMSITIDTQAPATPDAPTLAGDNGTHHTNDNTPEISGKAEANSTVTVYVDNVNVGTATADGSGNYTYTLSVQRDGDHSISVTATDAAGNTSAHSADLNIVIDTQAPVAPDLSMQPAANAHGKINTGTPVFSGTTEANATVHIIADGIEVTTVIADNTGHYTYTPAPALTDGAHTVKTSATDADGNTSTFSPTLSFTVDTHAPDAPSKPVLAGGNSGNTNDNTLTITGTAEPGSTVTVIVDGQDAAVTTADGSGNYTVTLPPQADGPHNVTAKATDDAGNTSQESPALNIIIDTAAPDAPVIISLEGGITDAITHFIYTNDNTPTIHGTAEANSTVTIYASGQLYDTVTADANGNFVFTFPQMSDGSWGMTAKATDAAGNSSFYAAQVNVMIDTRAPDVSAPILTSPAVNGVTGDNTPDISGQTAPDAKVDVYVDGKKAGTITADSNGNYTYSLPEQKDGSHSVTITATDGVGNTSAQSDPLNITVDTTPPAAPPAPVLTGGDGSNLTSDNTPGISGTAEPGSKVTVIVDGNDAGTTTADANGNYTYTLPTQDDGKHSVTVTATDATGHTSDPGAPLIVTIDTTAPAPPTLALRTGAKDGVINTTNPVVGGTAEANSTVTIIADGVPVGTVKADATGSYTYTFTQPLANGAHAVTATATDAAGNTSVPGNTLSFSIDMVPPAVPAAPNVPGVNGNGYVNTDMPVITGSGEPGTIITVYTDGNAIGTTTVDNNGNWTYSYNPAISEGEHSVNVTASDNQGNESGHSSSITMTVDLTAPTVSLTAANNNNSGPVTITISFSEDVTGFSIDSVLAANGVLTDFRQLSPNTYSVVVTPVTGTTLTMVTIPGNAAKDLAGNGNRASAPFEIRSSGATGINQVYPLPATDQVTVKFGGVNDGTGTVSMTNMAGQILQKEPAVIKNGLMVMNVSRLPAGTYVLLVYVKETNKTYTTTVVIAR